MFEAGSLIVYGSSGICRVEGASMKPQPGGGQAMYYTLTPLFGSGTVYTPVETRVFMRRVISGEEARELVRRMPQIEPDACEGTDQRTLTEHYRGLLHTYQCESLVKIIKGVYLKSKQAVARGKKLGKTDQQFMKRAEELLCEELSLALYIPKDQVKDHILKTLEPAAQ